MLNISANINCISEKSVNDMKMVYKKNDSNSKVNRSYFTLKKVNLYIIFNNSKKHKSIPSEFIVVRSDWLNYFPDLTLKIL